MSYRVDPENPTAGGDYAPGGFQLTGRRVAMIFFAFVATFVTVDISMWRMASRTFGGVVTTEPFTKGLAYGQTIEAAREQEERGWRVEEKISPLHDGKVTLIVTTRDKTGATLSGLAGEATFTHPADARRDVTVNLRERATGEYVADAELGPGVYVLVTRFKQAGKPMFMSRNRLQVFGG